MAKRRGLGRVVDGCVLAVVLALSAPARADEPSRLFEEETFGGNGRTCLTCHSSENGTLTLQQIAAIFAADPDDPLFLHDGSDDFQGNGVSRIRRDGTILVRRSLPPNIRLVANPLIRTVTLRRGIPTTMNTPGLDPVLMYDGRAPNLIQQALGAITDHAQATILPSQTELAQIAGFQTTSAFFSSPGLFSFSQGGQTPTLPAGNTASERRGRAFFDDVPLDPTQTRGICAICHSGPMLNEVNAFNPIPVPPFFVPEGERFQSILSAELLPNGDPQQAYLVTQPGSLPSVVLHTDPGRALETGDMRGFPLGDLGEFKIPTLWGVNRTAPYFHNNGAKTLDDVLDHYARFFVVATPLAIPGALPLILSEQDKADVVAFLNLL
jgi:cytochrome c peroxidase